MKFNFVAAIQFVVANIDQFKDIFEDGTELLEKIKDLYQSYADKDEPLAMGSTVELNEFLNSNPVLFNLSVAAVEPSSADEITAMTGPGAGIAVIKFLSLYGPLIKDIIKAWKNKEFPFA